MAVRVDAFPQQSFTGGSSASRPASTSSSRAFAIEGEVPNPDGKLKPGTFARVQITTDRVERAVTIPVAAVQSRYGTNRVFVVQNGQLAGREIVLGDRLGDRVEVSAGPRSRHADRRRRRRAARRRYEGHREVGPDAMSIADFCVKRPVFTTMLVMLFVVTGVFSFRDLSVDLLPKADPRRRPGADLTCRARARKS